jgi:hypothetical protein
MGQQVPQRLYHPLRRPLLNHVVRIAHDLSTDERLAPKKVHETVSVWIDDGSIGLLAHMELGSRRVAASTSNARRE